MAEISLTGAGDKLIEDSVKISPDVQKNNGVIDPTINKYKLLTKEELLIIDKNEPFWSRIRIALIVLFWSIWVLLIIASVVIIVYTPKCPVRPKLEFWQLKTAYWINPFTFNSSNTNYTGNLKGLMNAVQYIKDLGAGYVILTPLCSPNLNLPKDCRSVNPSLGTEEDFKLFVRHFKKQGMEVVVSLKESTNNTENVNYWLSKSVDGILMSMDSRLDNKTYNTISEIRSLVDNYTASSGRKKLFVTAVDSITSANMDNIGSLLGSDKKPGANLLFYPLSITTDKRTIQSLVTKYNQLLLSTSSPKSKFHSDLMLTVYSHLFPGSSAIFNGAELGLITNSNSFDPIEFVMPWNEDLCNRTDYCSYNNTVKFVKSTGRKSNFFDLTKELIRIRQNEPSLLWGKFEIITINGTRDQFFFLRKAAGFPTIIVAFKENSMHESVADFSHLCTELTPILLYPDNDFLKLNSASSTLQIFFTKEESVHIFKCSSN